MYKIPIKPLSVNQAYRRHRYRSKAYNQFRKDIGLLLNILKPVYPGDIPVFVHCRWGQSNMMADVDNPTKPFLDVLFDYWGVKEKDYRVHWAFLEKTKVPKGEEFIEFHIDRMRNLISYLESLTEQLKEGTQNGFGTV